MIDYHNFPTNELDLLAWRVSHAS